jgi:hypothetical protein
MATIGPTTTDELDTPVNMRRYRREVFAERLGWAVMGSVLVLAVVGAFGPGWLSRRVVSTADVMKIHYSALERHEAPAVLRVEYDSRVVKDGTITLAVSRSFLDQTSPEAIMPPPIRSEDHGDAVLFTFESRPTDARESAVLYRYRPIGMGPIRFRVGVVGVAEIALSQFILP